MRSVCGGGALGFGSGLLYRVEMGLYLPLKGILPIVTGMMQGISLNSFLPSRPLFFVCFNLCYSLLLLFASYNIITWKYENVKCFCVFCIFLSL